MEELDLKDLINMFWEKKIAIILITLVFMILGIFYSISNNTTLYSSSTSLVLAMYGNNVNTSTNLTEEEVMANSKLVPTFSELIKSSNIVRQVISNLGIEMDEGYLKSHITVTDVEDTEVIKITVSTEDAETSAKVANEIAKVFIEWVKEVYKLENIHVVDVAEASNEPLSINYKKYIIVFTFIGMVISVAYVFIVNMYDTTIKKPEDIEEEFDTHALSTIPLNKTKEKKELITVSNSKSPISEIFKTLRTNIQFMEGRENLKTILVTSVLQGEGNSWVASNLAVAFAQTGKKVVIVDADMRNGRQHSIFGLSPKSGLSNYLSGKEEDLKKYLQKTEIENLYLIPAGEVPVNPSELLVSEKMTSLLDKLKEYADIVIVDGPPSQLLTDSLIVTRLVDTTVIVAACKKTKKEDLKKLINNIKNVGGNIAGVVLNKVPMSMKKYQKEL